MFKCPGHNAGRAGHIAQPLVLVADQRGHEPNNVEDEPSTTRNSVLISTGPAVSSRSLSATARMPTIFLPSVWPATNPKRGRGWARKFDPRLVVVDGRVRGPVKSA